MSYADTEALVAPVKSEFTDMMTVMLGTWYNNNNNNNTAFV